MPLHLHIEATCHGNPGPSAIGYVIRDDSQAILTQAGRFLGELTDLESIVRSLLDGLEAVTSVAPQTPPVEIDVHTSSQWLARQMTGRAQQPGGHLEMMVTQAQMLLLRFDAWQILQTTDDENTLALALASHAASAGCDVDRPSEAGAATERPVKDRIILVRVVHGAEMRSCPEPCGFEEVFEFGEVAPAYMCLHALEAVLDVVMACKRGDEAALASLPVRRSCGKPGCGAEFQIHLA